VQQAQRAAVAPPPVLQKQGLQAAKSGVITRQGKTNEATGGGTAVRDDTLFTPGGVADSEVSTGKTILGG
tara:strand:- start:119 stop:328 length:210 start_codon:yes stop_codon:yes gene_type:complete